MGNPILVAGPVTNAEVNEIQVFAEFQLPKSYCEFVRRYGAAIVGPYPVFGCGASKAMGVMDASVIDVTKRFRADNWPNTDKALVVSTDHAGNAFTLEASGRVNCFDHDCGVSETIFDTFEGFLEWCMSR